MKYKLKLQDNVQILAGKDKGKQGKIIQMIPSDGLVVVDGINKMFKNIRSQKRGEKGQRIEFSAPLAISKVMLICPKCQKPARIGISKTDVKPVRTCKRCKESID